MRTRTLLALLALVVGMGAFIWFFERQLPSTEDRALEAKKLLAFDSASVKALTIDVGDSSLRLERSVAGGEPGGEPADWRLTRPVDGRADQERVESLLGLLGRLEKERTLEGVEAAELGLEAPRAEVTLEVGGDPRVLRVGSPVPASGNTVVEVDREPPYFVTADSFFDDLSRPLDDWRSREPLPFDESEIVRLRISAPTGVELEREGDGFRLVAPLSDVADQDELDALLSALVDLRVEEFLDATGETGEVPAETTLEPVAGSVEIWVEGTPEPIGVEVVGKAKAAENGESDLLLVRVGDQLFSAVSELPSVLGRPVSGWQSRRWTERDVFEIGSVTVSGPDGELGIRRSEGEWFRGEDRIEYSRASDFLYALTGARGLAGADPLAGAADDGPVELEVILASPDWSETLRLLRAGAGYRAQREGRAARLFLEKPAVEEILSKLEALASAPVLDQADGEELSEPVAESTD